MKLNNAFHKATYSIIIKLTSNEVFGAAREGRGFYWTEMTRRVGENLRTLRKKIYAN